MRLLLFATGAAIVFLYTRLSLVPPKEAPWIPAKNGRKSIKHSSRPIKTGSAWSVRSPRPPLSAEAFNQLFRTALETDVEIDYVGAGWDDPESLELEAVI